MPLQVGLLLSVNRWVRLGTNHFAHVSCQRVTPSVLFPLALILGAVTTLLYARHHSFALLLAARLAWGLAWSFIRQIGVLAVMEDTSVSRTGQVMGYYNGISRIGSVAGLFGGALLVDAVGFSPALVLLGVISFLGVPLGRVSVASLDRQVFKRRDRESDSGTRSWLFLWLALTLGAVGPGFVMSTLGYVMLARLGSDLSVCGITVGVATLTGALLAIRFVLDTLGAPYLGAMTDRLTLQRSSMWLFFIGALMLACAGLSRSPVVVAAAVIIFFLCGTALHACIAGRVGKSGSGNYARFVTAYDLGSASGPLAGWVVLSLYTEPGLGLLLGAALYALAALAVLFLPAKLH